MTYHEQVIAKAIFDWLNGATPDNDRPYVVMAFPEARSITVDGEVRCRALARFVRKRLREAGL